MVWIFWVVVYIFEGGGRLRWINKVVLVDLGG